MSEHNLKKLIYPVCDIAVQAGKIITKYYKSKTKIILKEDNSPLTQADLESNQLIENALTEMNNNIPILSEESLVDWSIRKKWSTYWLVDPLDGTKEFIREKEDFTVNIALIEKNLPVLGVIYVPVTKVIYFSYKNGGSYKLNIIENIKIENDFSNCTKLKTSQKTKNDILTIIGSTSHPNDNFKKWLSENVTKYELINKGSSLKFCNLAEGTADIYPRFRPSCEWDIAAGHIILIEAGGKLNSADDKEILYNLKESVINPHFIASCKILK